MTQPKIPMTLDQWIAFGKALKYGDEIAVLTEDITGNVIMWGSEDNKSPDPFKFVDYLHPVHTMRYLGLGRGATVEADPKGTQYHVIDEYRDRVMSGAVRLIVNRHLDLTVNEFESIKTEAERQIGKPYGWGAILGFGLYRLFRDTPIGSLWRAAKWQTPWCDRNSPVCSQGVREQEDTVKRFYSVLIALSTWQQNTPQRRFDETCAVTARIMDTFLIAKENRYDYQIMD
jgi:hypothetical protein